MRAQAIIDLPKISDNLRFLLTRSGTSLAIPMVKANAYGHGAVEVSQYLATHPEVWALGVATVSEGLELRAVIQNIRIIVFSGIIDLTEEEESACRNHALEPVITSLPTLKQWLKHRAPYHIEFNSGMNRIGFSPSALRSVLRLTKDYGPSSVLSHFAQSERANSLATRAQCSSMLEIFRAFQNAGCIFLHAMNSGAALQANQFPEIQKITNIIRPGIGLYGHVPDTDLLPIASALAPALELYGRVLARDVRHRGDRIGYGGTYRVKAPTETIALVGVGYGDGLHRLASNTCSWWDNKGLEYPIVGNISMDCHTVRCPRTVPVSSWLSFGYQNPITMQNICDQVQTIPYECLTSIGPRVVRNYIRETNS